MARIDYPDVDAPEVSELIEVARRERGGKLPRLFLMHMHNPAVFDAWLGIGSALRYRTSIDDRTRELAICMVSKLLAYDYQFDSHAPIAVSAGLDAGAVAGLPSWRDSAAFSDDDRLVLEYTEALTGQADVSDDLLGRVRDRLGEDAKVMELTATIAFYGCGARFLKALRIEASDVPEIA